MPLLQLRHYQNYDETSAAKWQCPYRAAFSWRCRTRPYLIPTALGVHKHQQGLHERSWHGLDDKGFPPPFLQETPQVLQQTWGNANSHLQLSPNITQVRSGRKRTSQPPRKPYSWDLPCQQAPSLHLTLLNLSADPAKPSCFPVLLLTAQSLCPSKTRSFPVHSSLTSAPFLLDFRLNDVLFFFLLDFSGF